jgi:hypothetical protein
MDRVRSSSPGQRCEYTRNVITADEWPLCEITTAYERGHLDTLLGRPDVLP